MQSKLQIWQGKMLSTAARSTQLQSVLGTMPLYPMHCLKLSQHTVDALDKVQRNYWWSHNSARQKHYISWSKLCLPKRNGGMGFKNLDVYNTALLTKTAWQLLHNQDSLCAKILRGKYCPYEDMPNYSLNPCTLWVWQSIYHGLQQVKRLSIWKVGDGKDINIWRHWWIPNSDGALLHPNELNLSDYQSFTDLIDEENHSWKVDLLQQLFTQEKVHQILIIPLNLTRKDKFVWPLTSTGQFTTKSAYNSLAITRRQVTLNKQRFCLQYG